MTQPYYSPDPRQQQRLLDDMLRASSSESSNIPPPHWYPPHSARAANKGSQAEEDYKGPIERHRALYERFNMRIPATPSSSVLAARKRRAASASPSLTRSSPSHGRRSVSKLSTVLEGYQPSYDELLELFDEIQNRKRQRELHTATSSLAADSLYHHDVGVVRENTSRIRQDNDGKRRHHHQTRTHRVSLDLPLVFDIRSRCLKWLKEKVVEDGYTSSSSGDDEEDAAGRSTGRMLIKKFKLPMNILRGSSSSSTVSLLEHEGLDGNTSQTVRDTLCLRLRLPNEPLLEDDGGQSRGKGINSFFCSNCGSRIQLEEGGVLQVAFCTECGARVCPPGGNGQKKEARTFSTQALAYNGGSLPLSSLESELDTINRDLRNLREGEEATAGRQTPPKESLGIAVEATQASSSPRTSRPPMAESSMLAIPITASTSSQSPKLETADRNTNTDHGGGEEGEEETKEQALKRKEDEYERDVNPLKEQFNTERELMTKQAEALKGLNHELTEKVKGLELHLELQGKEREDQDKMFRSEIQTLEHRNQTLEREFHQLKTQMADSEGNWREKLQVDSDVYMKRLAALEASLHLKTEECSELSALLKHKEASTVNISRDVAAAWKQLAMEVTQARTLDSQL